MHHSKSAMPELSSIFLLQKDLGSVLDMLLVQLLCLWAKNKSPKYISLKLDHASLGAALCAVFSRLHTVYDDYTPSPKLRRKEVLEGWEEILLSSMAFVP